MMVDIPLMSVALNNLSKCQRFGHPASFLSTGCYYSKQYLGFEGGQWPARHLPMITNTVTRNWYWL